jgi:CheY-like chemotaxis protein
MDLKDASVLFVDDSEDIRLLISYSLMSLGLKRCVLAGSLDQVQQLSDEALKTNIALLDINLGPNLPTGQDVYKWLIGNNYQGRIAFLTGYSIDDNMLDGRIDTTKTPVLTKPVPLKTLTDFIKGNTSDD